MARKVPWATTSTSTKSAKTLETPARALKRETTVSPTPVTENSFESTPKLRNERSKLNFEDTPARKRHRTSRSPSTSPIREPPSASPMRPGYDADDVYIMVEDEFQETAQKFTHHLHAAEYKRLKRKAQEAPKSGSLQLNGDAPKSVKRKFEVLAMEEKQREALDEENDDKSNKTDPWSGTTLARLMGRSSQPRRTLLGSQEVQSSTRAASGFGRGRGGSPRGNTLKRSASDLSKAVHTEDSVTTSDRTKRHDPDQTNDQTLEAVDKTKESRTTFSSNGPAKSSRPGRKKFTFDDGFDVESLDFTAIPEDRSPAKSKRKGKVVATAKNEEGKVTKTNLSDIPTFLY